MSAHQINCPVCNQSINELSTKCEFCGASISPNSELSPEVINKNSTPSFQKPAIVSEMMRHLEPMIINFDSKPLMIMLSPTKVKQSPKAPNAVTERAEFRLDFKKHANPIHVDRWVRTSYGESKNWSLSIYESNLKFPLGYLDDNQGSGSYEVVEVAMPGEHSLLYRRTIDATGEKLQRIQTACSSDRFWFAVPRQLLNNTFKFGTCHISEDLIIFTNRGYARSFAEENQIKEGRWFNSTDQTKKTSAGWLVGLSFFPIIMCIGIFFDGALTGVIPWVKGIFWGLIGLAMIVVGVIFLTKIKGEPV